MSAVPAALVKALGQLGDRAVVAVLVKSLAATLAIFSLAGWGLYLGLDALLRDPRVAAMLPEGLAPAAQVMAALVIGFTAFWFLFRVVALAVLAFFADEIVAAVEARHYPALAGQARPLPLPREAAAAARGLLRVIGYNLLALPLAALLAVTAIGPAVVFLGVNAMLLGRECTDMAWLRHCAGDERGNPVGAGDRFLLGAAVAGLMLVPLANVLAPVVGAAAGTHLVLRRLDGGARR